MPEETGDNMRRAKQKGLLAGSVVLVAGLGLCSSAGAGIVYPGNGLTGFGGAVGNGSLTFSDSAGNLTATFNPSGAFNSNDLVVYIDSVPGGFPDTSTFFDNGDPGRTAVSGANTGNPSQTLVTFPAGFLADYALEFENNTFIGLFGLASGGNNSLNFVTGTGPANGGPYTITFPIADLGIAPGASFSFDGTLVSTSAYRSNETIGASTTIPDGPSSAPNAGFNGQTIFSSADVYATTAVPEPTSFGLIGAVSLLLLRRRDDRDVQSASN
jgi:hypothetical protein